MSQAYPVTPRHNAPRHLCIPSLLADYAERTPDALAILAPERAPLTYGRLQQHMDDVLQMLHVLGLGRHDRIALVLPNGPEMAVAFLAVAAGATCVPLNPACGMSEFDLYFTGLHAQAVIVQAGMDSPARAMAHAHSLRIIELSPVLEAEAGIFTLTGEQPADVVHREYAQSADVALVLSTSGTTARPRFVPLTHTAVCTAAHDMGVALALVESDRLLNVMPLFHGHGLIATLLASLTAGASVVCPPGFDSSRFFAWMTEFHPTWYSAVPTIHQAILGRAALHRETIASYPLRLIRSSSAALPPQVLTELERVFHAPVIEAYGMTEVPSIACNPLPPRPRKTSSVGVATGPEVAIMDDRGNLLPAGESGEVVVRGVSVMQGYDNDPLATRNAFTHGWLRTGDQGFLDTEGYLFITGRFKEIINRGGEKIAPQEVDDVLMDHPAVAQAVTFAVPDARLREEIAAAVVLRQHAAATERDLRQFVATRLADFKVPRRVLIVEELPQGPIGKLQRLGLVDKLGLVAPKQAEPTRHPDDTAPRTLIEEMLVGLWTQVLDLACVGIHDDFFQVGGDSLLVLQLLSRIRDALHVEVPLLTFFEAPTVASLALHIETAQQAAQGMPAPPIVPIPRDGPVPMSIAQEQLWRLDQALPGTALFNVLYTMRLTGTLMVTALEQSCNEILRRHEALRTTFAVVEGQPVQVITPPPCLTLMVQDLRALPETERDGEAQRLAREEVQKPFDLTQGLLLRVRLLRLGEQEHVLLLTMHHIISDAWSLGVFMRELAVLYTAFSAGSPSPLPELSIQYADFAYWQRQWRRSEAIAAQLAYWQEQLHAPLPILALPTDRPRGTALSFRTALQTLVLPEELSAALKTLSWQEGSTLFMTLLAAFKVLLHGYTGQEELCIGTLVANRNRQEVEGLIGLFVNTVLVRTNLGGNPTFREVLRRVRKTTLAAYAHQDLPFEDLVQTLEHEHHLQRRSLCQGMFILQNAMRQPAKLSDLTLSFIGADESVGELGLTVTAFDIVLTLWESPQGLAGSCIYKTTLFDAATINQMLEDYQRVLKHIIVQPEQSLSTFGSPSGERVEAREHGS
jgi:acyl-CoA synthetase (AMP-forming)/AMP-acid ligase II/aryl carrier-like protein